MPGFEKRGREARNLNFSLSTNFHYSLFTEQWKCLLTVRIMTLRKGFYTILGQNVPVKVEQLVAPKIWSEDF